MICWCGGTAFYFTVPVNNTINKFRNTITNVPAWHLRGTEPAAASIDRYFENGAKGTAVKSGFSFNSGLFIIHLTLVAGESGHVLPHLLKAVTQAVIV
jgi:hypothetical protein